VPVFLAPLEEEVELELRPRVAGVALDAAAAGLDVTAALDSGAGEAEVWVESVDDDFSGEAEGSTIMAALVDAAALLELLSLALVCSGVLVAAGVSDVPTVVTTVLLQSAGMPLPRRKTPKNLLLIRLRRVVLLRLLLRRRPMSFPRSRICLRSRRPKRNDFASLPKPKAM